MTPARGPRFFPFILTGAVLGFLAGAGISASGRFEDTDSVLLQQGQYTPTAGMGYLGLLGAALLAIVAALVALALDWWARRS